MVHHRARKRAGELGVSLAEYVRRLIARDLGQPKQRVDPSVVFDLGNSGGSDVSRDKNSLLGEAAGRENKRSAVGRDGEPLR